jgi:hypothetical protein
MKMVDCEWEAAARYDTGRNTIYEIAKYAMGACLVSRMKVARMLGYKPFDPEAEAIDFEYAVKNVEAAREARTRRAR